MFVYRRLGVRYLENLFCIWSIDLEWPYLRSSDTGQMYSIHYYTAKQGSCVGCRGRQ